VVWLSAENRDYYWVLWRDRRNEVLWKPGIHWLPGIQRFAGLISESWKRLNLGAGAELVALEFEVETAASEAEFASCA